MHSNQFRLSEQLHICDVENGWKGIYSPFGHKFAFLWDDIFNKIKRQQLDNVDPEILKYLQENNILVQQGFEKKWFENINKPAEVTINNMFLVVTQACNMGCKYCAVIENFDNPNRFKECMSIEVGRNALDLFYKQLTKHKLDDSRITFYGGEPLLNKKLLLDLIPRIRDKRLKWQKKSTEIVLITNGLIYDSALTTVFKNFNVGVCVSLDGLQKHQDVTRITRKDKKSTFDKVISNYYKYQNAGLTMGISTAIGKHNIYDLKEICNFYIDKLKPNFVEFQIPYQVSNESNDYYISTSQITEILMDAYNLLISNGIIEGLGYRRIRDIMNGTIHLRDCGSSGFQLVVAPDGMIGPCHSMVGTRTFFSDNVLNKKCSPETNEHFKLWARRYPLRMEECLVCPFVTICGGGCIYNSYVSSGSIWNKDPQVCTYLQGMMNWILKNIWNNYKNNIN